VQVNTSKTQVKRLQAIRQKRFTAVGAFLLHHAWVCAQSHKSWTLSCITHCWEKM